MKTAVNPYTIRMNDEDANMMTFLQERLGMGTTQVLRLAVRRLFQSEQAAAKREAK